VEAPLGPIVVHITDDGFVEPYTGDEQPSLIVKVNPDVALNWLKDGEVGSKGVRIEGDAQFASDLSRIVGMLDWDYEEDMAQVFGDVIAHRLGEMLRGFGRWMSGARESMKASVSDYLTEESRLLVTPVGVEMFIRGDETTRNISTYEVFSRFVYFRSGHTVWSGRVRVVQSLFTRVATVNSNRILQA
jgi:ubiquinone biosynthesis protein UbiJ